MEALENDSYVRQALLSCWLHISGEGEEERMPNSDFTDASIPNCIEIDTADNGTGFGQGNDEVEDATCRGQE